MIGYTTLKLSLWNSSCAALLGLGIAFGYVGPVFSADISHVSWICAALAAFLFVYTAFQSVTLDQAKWSDVEAERLVALPFFLKGEVFVLLGLCGTLIGITIMATNMGSTGGALTADDIGQRINMATAGMKTAFGATLVGIVCKLYGEVVYFILGGRVRELGGKL